MVSDILCLTLALVISGAIVACPSGLWVDSRTYDKARLLEARAAVEKARKRLDAFLDSNTIAPFECGRLLEDMAEANRELDRLKALDVTGPNK